MADNYDKYKYEIDQTLDKAIKDLSSERFRELLNSISNMLIEYKKDIDMVNLYGGF